MQLVLRVVLTAWVQSDFSYASSNLLINFYKACFFPVIKNFSLLKVCSIILKLIPVAESMQAKCIPANLEIRSDIFNVLAFSGIKTSKSHYSVPFHKVLTKMRHQDLCREDQAAFL